MNVSSVLVAIHPDDQIPEEVAVALEDGLRELVEKVFLAAQEILDGYGDSLEGGSRRIVVITEPPP